MEKHFKQTTYGHTSLWNSARDVIYQENDIFSDFRRENKAGRDTRSSSDFFRKATDVSGN
jgi:hypothetical protein